MPSSKTEIVNIALLRLGVTDTVADIDIESSREATTGRLLFDNARDAVLREVKWPWATEYATLGLVGGSPEEPVSLDWIYSYRLPANSLFARRLVTELGREDTDPPPFKLGRDGAGRLVFCNLDPAVLEFTARITDTHEFDALFVDALAWRLAKDMAPSLCRDAKLADRCSREYLVALSTAAANSANEQHTVDDPLPDWIRARD